MRGILTVLLIYERGDRIIPAHAGNTLQALFYYVIFRDHPRSCGEYGIGEKANARIIGSSPLMRGILTFNQESVQIKRIIPAHAGNTYLLRFAQALFKDHPRSCGEYKN